MRNRNHQKNRDRLQGSMNNSQAKLGVRDYHDKVKKRKKREGGRMTLGAKNPRTMKLSSSGIGEKLRGAGGALYQQRGERVPEQ